MSGVSDEAVEAAIHRLRLCGLDPKPDDRLPGLYWVGVIELTRGQLVNYSRQLAAEVNARRAGRL